MGEQCIFCKIIAKETTADIAYEDDLVVAFHDINPQAPLHLLVVPKEHIPSLNDVTEAHAKIMGHIPVVAKEITKKNGLAEDGWRLVINCGPDAKQTVFHLHAHILGGRPMSGHMA